MAPKIIYHMIDSLSPTISVYNEHSTSGSQDQEIIHKRWITTCDLVEACITSSYQNEESSEEI